MDIQSYRIKRALTQQQLADLLGVSNITVSKWENGQSKPSGKFIEKINSMSIEERIEVIPFRPVQYLGSKLKLLRDIEDLAKALMQEGKFCDLFSGSGVVSNYMSHRYNVVSCDIQNYSTSLTSALVNKSPMTQGDLEQMLKEVDKEFISLENNILALVDYEENLLSSTTEQNNSYLLNFSNCASLYINKENARQVEHKNNLLEKLIGSVISLKSLKDYQIFYLYGGVYFSYKQALYIDLLRQKAQSLDSESDRNLIIACLLSAASDVVNTVGKQFAQPMKLVDRNGNIKKLQLKRTIQNKSYSIFDKLNIAFSKFKNAHNINNVEQHEIICSDVFDFLDNYNDKIGCFYADPPYTIDHYSRFYHVLETISLYDCPELSYMNKKGQREIMNGLYRIDRHQSEFCVPSQAKNAFEKLFSGCRKFGAPLILSYSPFDNDNNERSRLLTKNDLEKLAKKYYSKVTFIENNEHRHRKLHSTNKNKEVIKSSEIFIICEVE
ncbi:DNA adenine methylase [Shewanella algae]|uniref:DNA adenine methylase n=1 Tax=Shewanella algae TaxID=38313 RepID=UPI0031F547D9